ncbi:MAG: hypothetical protein JWO78_2270 [Micavibrio sp.]|nr:hypothetical protein [Micavibrio sp.]
MTLTKSDVDTLDRAEEFINNFNKRSVDYINYFNQQSPDSSLESSGKR